METRLVVTREIEAVRIGRCLSVLLNGRALGIVESNPEFAFTHWGERQRRANDNRRYALLRDDGVLYRHDGQEWRAA